jgi:hypothetical protein
MNSESRLTDTTRTAVSIETITGKIPIDVDALLQGSVTVILIGCAFIDISATVCTAPP